MNRSMEEKFIRDFLMLWATIDPIGTLSIFAAVTSKQSTKLRRKTALKAILYSSIILIACIVLGELILTGMGIKLISLQVAGGIILFLFGLQMIFGTVGQGSQPEKGHDVAVYPLAIPSIASPGAIMAVILLTDNDVYSIPVQMGTTGILVGILIISYILMMTAGTILKVIGQNGANILIRVMGIILTALSVELVLDALAIGKWVTGGS